MDSHDHAATLAEMLGKSPQRWERLTADELTEIEQDALKSLTAAGFIERRIVFGIRLPGDDQTATITIEVTGEAGLADAMTAATQDLWARWGRRWKEIQDSTGEVVRPIVQIQAEQWRLTEQGRLARDDLKRGDQTPIDFALKQGFFAGPRLHPNGMITGRPPVRGHGRVVAIDNSPGTTLQTAITNWNEGAKAFAAALRTVPRAVHDSDELLPIYEGDGHVRLGNRVEIFTADNERRLIEHLVERQKATTSELEDAGVTNPAIIAKRVRERFDGFLSPYLTTPGRQRNAGYELRIIDGRGRTDYS